MLTKMRSFLPMIWKQILAPRIPWVPLLTAGEQTKLTWAKIIESYEMVPKAYQNFFASFFADGQALPYTVFTPSREGFLNRTTEKLICIHEQEIYVLEGNENTFQAQCYPIEGISYVEVKSVLLSSHIKISGITTQGASASSTIKFNSVGDHLFTPILKKIRLATADPKDSAENPESKKFDHLIKLNYKFMNYARRSLLAGEKVIHFILQPEIQVPVLKILSKTYFRAISPTHMCILTDQELITISEDEPKNRAVGKYGGIWNYIQLNKIVSLTLNRKDDDLLVLSIQLVGSIWLEYLFQSSTKQELNQLLEQFEKLAARKQ
jgi:hypothetical protein